MLALTGLYWPGFAILAIPGVVAMLLLLQLRRRTAMLDDAAVAQTPAPTLATDPGRPTPGPAAAVLLRVRPRRARPAPSA